MPEPGDAIERWVTFFKSDNISIRERAAKAILDHGADAPLSVLLEILDDLSDHGFGAKVQRVLQTRRDTELIPAMIDRLRGPDAFVREVACWVLGELNDRSVTPRLVDMLSDTNWQVRRAAAFSLGSLADPRTIQPLLDRYRNAAEDINVRMALERALKALGVALPSRGG